MTTIEALISGIVQGLTEFLPVSSSGHLVLVHHLFGVSTPDIFFDICLHLATLMAVILYFGKDIGALIREKNTRMLLYITIGTIPAVIAALIFETKIETLFMDPTKVAIMLIITAIALFIGQYCLWKRTPTSEGPTSRISLMIGIAQAFALIPGISRSGITISTGLLGGVKAEEVFKFSFLLSIPIIIGAAIYKGITLNVEAVLIENLKYYIVGMAAAFIVGLISLRLLWWLVKSKRLFIFAIYCLLLGIVVILIY